MSKVSKEVKEVPPAFLKETERVCETVIGEEIVKESDEYFQTQSLLEEFTRFDQLMYKYHNQQRRHVHYRRLKLLRRRMQRVLRAKAYIYWGVVRENLAKDDWTRVVMNTKSLAEQAIVDCRNAFESVYTLLLDQLYVPFAVVMLGMVARIHTGLKRFASLLSGLINRFHSGDYAISDDKKTDTTKSEQNDDRVIVNNNHNSKNRHKQEEDWSATSTEKRKRFVKKMKKTTDDVIDDIFK